MFDRLLKKDWIEEDIKKYIGDFKNTYLTYSAEEDIRKYAGSGGTTSALLIYALDKKLIDGAIVCKTNIQDGKVRTKFVIARTRQEILSARGSKYVATKFPQEVFPQIRKFDGRLAVVGLPCNISLLMKLAQNDASIERKIFLTIALVCGHNSQPELIDRITQKLEKEANSKLINYKFRVGHWRGKLRAEFKNGLKIEKHSFYFNLYQNLNFFSEKKCLFCHDHFGYNADLSTGDIWLFYFKKNPIKHNSVISKTDKGDYILRKSIDAGYIVAADLKVEDILDGQSRVAPFHYNVSARHKAGKLIRVNIPDKLYEKVKWHEFVIAFIMILNWKWSQNKKFAEFIFKVPRPLMKVYLYILKALESLK